MLASLVQAGLGRGSAHLALYLGGVLAVGGWIWLLVSVVRQGWSRGAVLLGVPLAVALVARLIGFDATWAMGLARLALVLAGGWFAFDRLDQAGLPLVLILAGLACMLFGGPILEGGALTLFVPDLQVFWVADAAYAGDLVPASYVVGASVYAAVYALGTLAVGAFLLHGRELGS